MVDLSTIGISNNLMGSVGKGAWYIAITISILGLVFVICYIGWLLSKYKIFVYVHQPLGKRTDRIIKTKGKVYFDKKIGTSVLKLFKKINGEKVILQAPLEEDYSLIGKKKAIELSNPSPSNYFVVNRVHTNYEVITPDIKRWYLMDMKRSTTKLLMSDTWTKYAPTLVIGDAMVIALVIIIIAFKYGSDMVSQSSQAANALKNALEQVTITKVAPATIPSS